MLEKKIVKYVGETESVLKILYQRKKKWKIRGWLNIKYPEIKL